ncbi:AmmeMemoRadiSam system protein A [bacterium]|nr:AmmeMemoRadiSam system protein A [bacterium]MBU1072923.1 AmmeMemoRadiSam system protein A [bacterium]MBU1674795.1 AmmeMemoRadiSam system protein A [bacterium]
MSKPLTAAEKSLLLRLARAVVTAGAHGEPLPEPAALGPLTASLQENRGAFVTLHLVTPHHGCQLRGCIGYIEDVKPLADAIVDNALSAAFKDPRFTPVTDDELEDLEIEISALTPLRAVGSWRDIQVPRHGVVLTRGTSKSVFLPQVAEEQGWDRDTLLSHLALKAGLSPDAWREGAAFQVFEADVFSEKELA